MLMKRILFVSLCIGALALAACQGSGINLDKALDAGSDAYKAATLDQAQAIALGKQSADAMDKENKVASAGSAYGKRLARLTKKLKNEDGLNLNFKVYMVRDVNAFSLPDGSIRVFAGLMDLMKDDNELLFVIGHEIGHVKNGDSLDAMRMAYASSAAQKGASASGGVAGAVSDSQIGALSQAFVNAQFSQSQEKSADEYGLALLKKYNKPLSAAPASLRQLASLSDDSSMLSSHPASSKRAERLEKMIAAGK